MFVIRNVFKCKPGQAKHAVEKFKKAQELMADVGFKHRVLVDEIAHFWTVVVEIEVEDLAGFDRSMHEYGSRSAVQEAMAGYLDMIDGGYREIFRVA
jgi:hypothetical protein